MFASTIFTPLCTPAGTPVGSASLQRAVIGSLFRRVRRAAGAATATLEFTLRPNVKFHIGDTFSAEAVRFNWQKAPPAAPFSTVGISSIHLAVFMSKRK